MSKLAFAVGMLVVAENIQPLEGNDKAPPLKPNGLYTVNGITLDEEGNQHLDVGIPSEVSYVRSWETKEELPDGDKIWWCHPSRFIIVETTLELRRVVAVEDGDNHWYVIPVEEHMNFLADKSLIAVKEDEDPDEADLLCHEFDKKWGGYRTGGDLNNKELWAVLPEA